MTPEEIEELLTDGPNRTVTMECKIDGVCLVIDREPPSRDGDLYPHYIRITMRRGDTVLTTRFNPPFALGISGNIAHFADNPPE